MISKVHEWAMQYQPDGAPEPPSAKYQAHLPLRVSRETINKVVERKGVHCTHVDALRWVLLIVVRQFMNAVLSEIQITDLILVNIAGILPLQLDR